MADFHASLDQALGREEKCHHCRKPPEPDGDHSCDCPFTDSECLEHTLNPVTEDERVRTAQRRLQREYVEHLEAQVDRMAPALARVRRLLRFEYVSRDDLHTALVGGDRDV